MNEDRRVEDALADDAIQDLIHEVSGGDDGLLLRWVVVAETITDDGERHVIWQCQEEMVEWEARGLLREGMRQMEAEE